MFMPVLCCFVSFSVKFTKTIQNDTFDTCLLVFDTVYYCLFCISIGQDRFTSVDRGGGISGDTTRAGLNPHIATENKKG